MRNIFLIIVVIILFSFIFVGDFSYADYTEAQKREWLNSPEGQRWMDTYCDGECDDIEKLISRKDWEESGLGKGICDGIKLNTDFPLIGNCIKLKKGDGSEVDTTTVLPKMLGSLMKIIMAVVMVVCFAMIIIAGIKRSSNDTKTARDLIKKVAVTILVLGLSGVILKVINPLFFS